MKIVDEIWNKLTIHNQSEVTEITHLSLPVGKLNQVVEELAELEEYALPNTILDKVMLLEVHFSLNILIEPKNENPIQILSKV